jgi:hypothetical protein
MSRNLETLDRLLGDGEIRLRRGRMEPTIPSLGARNAASTWARGRDLSSRRR